MHKPLWPAVDVTGWSEIQAETRGQRPKRWVRDPHGQEWLRKEPRISRPSEPAIEVFALELARAAGVQTAVSQPCVWQSDDGPRRGIVVRLFVDRTREEMSLGSEVLQMHVPAYDPESKWAQTTERARATLAELGASASADLLTSFAHILAFDAWIGNGDRHQENWGVIRPAQGIAPGARLAPMFDPASCLGAELQDGHILLRDAPDNRIRDYIQNCPSGFGDGRSAVLLSHVLEQVRVWPEWTKNVRAWLAAFDAAMNTGMGTLSEVPDDWLSTPRKQLAKKLLMVRLDWLKEKA